MKKRDSKELAKEFNELRQKNQGKTFLGSEMQKMLNKYGFNSYLVSALRQQKVFNILPCGASKLYSFREEPLHYTAMEIAMKEAYNMYKKYYIKKTSSSNEAPKAELTPEEQAIRFLKNQGFQLKKCVGFDESSFSKDYPELYKKYLKYESV